MTSYIHIQIWKAAIQQMDLATNYRMPLPPFSSDGMCKENWSIKFTGKHKGPLNEFCILQPYIIGVFLKIEVISITSNFLATFILWTYLVWDYTKNREDESFSLSGNIES